MIGEICLVLPAGVVTGGVGMRPAARAARAASTPRSARRESRGV